MPALAAEKSEKRISLFSHDGSETLKAEVGNGFTSTSFVAVVDGHPITEVLLNVTV